MYKDELYVGVGLMYQESQLNFRSEPPNKYFFEGDERPEDFSLQSDTAWIFFLTDRNVEYSGFRLSWTANVDQDPPIITSCPSDDIIGSVTIGVNDSTIITWQEPAAEDTIGPLRVAQSHRSGESFPVGITTVEYRFYDGVNNEAFCRFNVTVIGVDVTPPVISNCPSFIFQQVSLGTGDASVRWIEPSATDNSGTAILAQRSHRPGSSFQPGVVDVVYVFADPAGNEATCTFRVTVEEVDREPPVISNCPRNVVEEINVGTGGAIRIWEDPTVSDNSGTVMLISQSHTSGSLFLPGTSRVAYVYEDPSRNRAVCSFTITVIEVDTIPPVVQCNDNISVSISLNIGGARVDWDEPTATDNSGFVTLTSKSHNPGAFFPPGERVVTYVFTDGAGNSADCTFTVTVTEVDSEQPQVICPDDMRQDIPLGSGGTTVRWSEPQVSDNSGNAILIYQSHRSGNFFPTGFTDVTYRYRDPAANVVECNFVIRIIEIDTVAPSVACTADITQVIPIGSGGVVVTWTEPVATDNSGTAMLTLKTHSPGTLFETGSTIVMYVYEDPSGNTASCEFNVTVTEIDDAPPEITGCPSNIEIAVDLSEGGAIVNWTEPVATDNSGIVVLSLQTHLTGSYFASGVSSVTYLYEDMSGNLATCTFDVTVTRVDTSPPMVICPEDVHLTILTGMGGSGISWVEPTVTDNSGNAFLRSQSHTSGQYFEVGMTSVAYMYADFSGNTGSCSFLVSITEANPCEQAPCYNGGLCVIDGVAEYTCLCQECFQGDNCEIELNACSNHMCENGATCMPHPGSCTQYFCGCSDCNAGRYCEEAINACENHQCQNGGRCLEDPASCSSYSCQCTACFTGDFCQEILDPCQDHQCQNLGTCVPLSSGACSGYVCECPSCFTGLYCDQRYDLCDLNPCRNNGTCLSGLDSCFVFKCFCAPCWTGYMCEIRKEEITGTCLSGLDSCFVFKCFCAPCWTGYMCEIPTPSQCVYEPCKNGGTCTSIDGACDQYTCTCPPGFTGVNCEIGSSINENACSSNPCLYGGSCLTMDGDYYICLCSSGYVGIDCGTAKANFLVYDACRNFPCEGSSTCYNSYNSVSTPQGVFTRQYTCVCPPRYTGRNCGDFVDNAVSEDVCSLGSYPLCQNGGLCVDAYHSYDRKVDYVCICPDGWSGHNCETPYTSACDSSPCQNQGICTSMYSYFFCTCTPGFLGTTCEIDVVDIVPPIISNCPQSLTISAGDDINATVSWTEPRAIDNSGRVTTYRQTHQPSDDFTVGTTAVTYIFMDPSMNAASCTFFVTVTSRAVDTTSPRIFGCPDDITVTATPGLYSAIIRWQEPTAIDNSGEQVTMTRTHYPGNQFPLGNTNVVYTFTDSSGNEAACSFDVTVVLVDTTPPVLTYCPEDIEQLITSGALFVTLVWDRPNATDESGSANLTSSTLSSESLFVRVDGVPFEVMYVFSDDAGNSVTCSFTVSAISSLPDQEPPVITGCPSDILITIPPGDLTGSASWIEPRATDDSNRPPVIIRSHQPGALFPLGDSVVSYLFSDSAGNRAECTFTVAVSDVDSNPPVITGCPVDTLQVISPPGTVYTLIQWDRPTAVDDAGPARLVSETGARSPTFVLVNQPPVAVEYVFEDISGNEAACRFTISAVVGVPDTSAPVVNNCPQDITVTIPPSGTFSTTATWLEPVAFDDSGRPPILTKSHEPGLSQFPVGETSVSYVYRDAARNDAVCVFTVTVMRDFPPDITPPEISGCPDDIVTIATIGVNQAIVTWTPPTATDDSTEDVNQRPLPPNVRPGALFSSGTTAVTYTFVDSSENEASCTFNITVIPAQIDGNRRKRRKADTPIDAD
ncbi:uncharacterized protein [Amphiura filiformis]|uniref:uncharacterized protein n=1 Tax=Amphiura filiformis TaxID=82378 RepID=UPI003B21DCC4